MMKTQKEHRKSTLMSWSKEELAEHIMCLEHNINALNESFDNQYNNCLKLLNDMELVGRTYTEAKMIIKSMQPKDEQVEGVDKND